MPMVPMQKTWMDKLADAILGSDPATMGPEQKYALICARCHAHNGLALKEEFNEVQYVCPHCGHFNSRRPSSAPVSSPFNSSTNKTQRPAQQMGEVETPSKPSRVERGSRLKLRADESESGSEEEDVPPSASLQEERGGKEVMMKEGESPREERLKSLRARKSHTKGADGMDLDDE